MVDVTRLRCLRTAITEYHRHAVQVLDQLFRDLLLQIGIFQRRQVGHVRGMVLSLMKLHCCRIDMRLQRGMVRAGRKFVCHDSFLNNLVVAVQV